MTDPASGIGDTSLARAFYAGRYAEVVAATFDVGAFPDEDLAFVVGALTFLGRLEDAELSFDAWRARTPAPDVRTLEAARFFLGVAHARAGDFERARRYLVRDVKRRTRLADPWAGAFLQQGLACHRYFTGRHQAAAGFALRALRAAHEAHFPYAQMLATDLRGHALVQVGKLRAGVALLEQARVLSERLGFGMNAYAIECSIAVYTARFVARPEALDRIEVLLGRSAHDAYSRRGLLTEAAIQLALRGRRTDATVALAQADDEALRMDARRAKVTSLIARLHVARWGEGAPACADVLAQAAELVDEDDVAFRAELFGFEAYVGEALGDRPRRARSLAGLRSLVRSSELHRARAALEQLGEGERPEVLSEDELTPLLGAVARRDRQALPRLLGLGLLGPIPELLGMAPGRRIIVLPREHAVLLEDHGDVRLKPDPPRWCPTLLGIIAGGASKESIVTRLWGLRAYHPDRHNPLLRTTIHRLRTFLEPNGDWIVATDQGYGVAVPVHFVGDGLEPVTPGTASPEPERAAEPGLLAPLPAPSLPPAGLTHDPVERVHARLTQLGRATVRQLARALALSPSTVLRALRELVAAARVTRHGAARATWYDSTSDPSTSE